MFDKTKFIPKEKGLVTSVKSFFELSIEGRGLTAQPWVEERGGIEGPREVIKSERGERKETFRDDEGSFRRRGQRKTSVR